MIAMAEFRIFLPIIDTTIPSCRIFADYATAIASLISILDAQSSEHVSEYRSDTYIVSPEHFGLKYRGEKKKLEIKLRVENHRYGIHVWEKYSLGKVKQKHGLGAYCEEVSKVLDRYGLLSEGDMEYLLNERNITVIKSRKIILMNQKSSIKGSSLSHAVVDNEDNTAILDGDFTSYSTEENVASYGPLSLEVCFLTVQAEGDEKVKNWLSICIEDMNRNNTMQSVEKIRQAILTAPILGRIKQIIRLLVHLCSTEDMKSHAMTKKILPVIAGYPAWIRWLSESPSDLQFQDNMTLILSEFIDA